MIDLVTPFPAVADCNKLIIAAGGPSIAYYRHSICDQLEAEPATMLFDINAHLDRYEDSHKRLSKIKNPKFMWAVDYGVKEIMRTRVAQFLTLPQSCYMLFYRPQLHEAIKHLPKGRCLKYATVRSNSPEADYNEWRKTKNTGFRWGT